MSISAPVSSLYDSPDRREPEQIVRDIQDKLCKGNLAPSDFIESFDRHNKKQKWYPIMEMLQFGYLAESDLREWVGWWCDVLARKQYGFATMNYADHVPHPEHLAWGLSRKLFSRSELQLICFDDGDGGGGYVGENYVKTYLPRDFIDSILEKLCDPVSWGQDMERMKSNMKQISAKVGDCCDGHCCC